MEFNNSNEDIVVNSAVLTLISDIALKNGKLARSLLLSEIRRAKRKRAAGSRGNV